MDGLLHHCLRELAFDGDYGCSVARLQDFVNGYYASHASLQQFLDESYYTFIWTLLSQHISVIIGLIPEGQTSQVYVPPPARAKKSEEQGSQESPNLELIPDARSHSLQELVNNYGNRLRIAVDSETCFEAITGFHVRPTKLTPAVYACLQLISRSREEGLSVLDLGRTTGYDQKSCFHLVRSLVELDLVVKLRRGGESMNFCVHKYFFERSDAWRRIHEEEHRAQAEAMAPGYFPNDNDENTSLGSAEFDLIDMRHLSNLNILRQRLILLLRQTEAGIQPYYNIAVRLGFRPRSRTDRRFFIHRLKELISEGTIEKISITGKGDGKLGRQLGLRLVSAEDRKETSAFSMDTTAYDEKMEEELIDSEPAEDGNKVGLKSDVTLHRQIIELLHDSGAIGMTVQDLSNRLGRFDRRTLEQIVVHMKSQTSLSHLADLTIVDAQETHGRERRYRYFTSAGYAQLLAREGMNDKPNDNTRRELSQIGEFMATDGMGVYKDQKELDMFLDKWVQKSGKSGPKAPARSSVRMEEPTSAKIGRPLTRKKEKVYVNPLLPDGTRKKGRPPKKRKKQRLPEAGFADVAVADSSAVAGHAIGAIDEATPVLDNPEEREDHVEQPIIVSGQNEDDVMKDVEAISETQPKRRRGRPPKKKRRLASPTPDDGSVPEKRSTFEANRSNENCEEHAEHALKPAEVQNSADASQCVQMDGIDLKNEVRLPRRRGRPPKNKRSVPRRAKVSVDESVSIVGEDVIDLVSANMTVNAAPLPSGEDGAEETDMDVEQQEAHGADSEHPAIPSKCQPNGPLLEQSSLSTATTSTIQNPPPVDEHTVYQAAVTAAAMDRGLLRDDSRSTSTSRRSTTSLTAFRRQNEIVQILNKAGGIINTTGSDILGRHADILRALTEVGEATSAPVGTTMDRRTLVYCLESLEEAGRIKLVRTTVQSGVGVRSLRLAYLPAVSEEDVHKYIQECQSFKLVQTGPPRKKAKARDKAEIHLEGVLAPTSKGDHESRVEFRGFVEPDNRAEDERQVELSITSRQETSEKRQKKRRHKWLKTEQAEKESLHAQEALKTVRHREQAWNHLVQKVRPGLLKGVAEARLRKLRRSYVSGDKTQDDSQWELDITEAIRTAEKVRLSRTLPKVPATQQQQHKLLQFRTQKQSASDATLRSTVQGSEQAGYLTGLQRNGGESLGPRKPRVKKAEEARDGTEGGRIRRRRFQWKPELDELARDAYVIIHARCRSHHRTQWVSIEQVFPDVPRNTVRVRVAFLREQPGVEAYLRRLEDCWYDLWMKNRATDDLPDKYPWDPTDFDLKAHINYLRKHIDKNGLRVGISHELQATLPASLTDLKERWAIIEQTHEESESLLYGTQGDEAREKVFLEDPFVIENDSPHGIDISSDLAFVFESAVKMVMGTPDDVYREDIAAALLHKLGEQNVKTAVNDLLSRNELSKLNRDPTRSMPGRTLKISDTSQSALSGVLSSELFEDASQLEESYTLGQPNWNEWPLVSSEGDTAAILQHISDHIVEFQINTDRARAARAVIEGNSRKADDDDIELSLLVKFGSVDLSSPVIPMTDAQSDLMSTEISGHGLSTEGQPACCKLQTDGIFDCMKCIEEAAVHIETWSEDDRNAASFILRCLEDRKEAGLELEQLKMALTEKAVDTDLVYRLSTLRVPLLYFLGHATATAVSAKFVACKTIEVSGGNQPVVRVFPRRWLDIHGSRIESIWAAALRAVLGLIHLKPAISQEELRWKMKATYDRLELIDILVYLLETGSIRALMDSGSEGTAIDHPEIISAAEERCVHWFIKEGSHWYHTH